LIRKAELRILEVEHALSEGPAVADVLERQGEGQLRGRQVTRGLGHAHVVQHAHDLLEAAAFAAAEEAIAPTRTFSKKNSDSLAQPRCRVSMGRPRVTPGVATSTRKMLMLLAPASASVLQTTGTMVQRLPLVIQVLFPLIT
jgi:hypothetical protein